MRPVVAGGMGMIGSNVAKLLPAPVILDLKNGYDLRDPKDCELAAGALVFDLAAPTEGIGSHNFSDVARIPLNLLAKHPKRYIYVSSSCVYPDTAEVPTEEYEGLASYPESANEGYGWGKRCGELACKYSDVPHTIVRPGNIYGPSYDWSRKHKHVIPALIEKMLRRDETIVVWGDGYQSRSFMYEEDCAKLIVALSKYDGIYNLGGWEMRIGHLVKLLVELTGYQGKIVFDSSKPTGPMRKAQCTKRMERVLGKVVLTPIEEGLRKTIDAMVNSHSASAVSS